MISPSYDNIYDLYAWQDNNRTFTVTTGEGGLKSLCFVLKDKQGAIDVSYNSDTAYYAVTRPDGDPVLIEGKIATDGSPIKFDIEPSLTAVTGIAKGEVRLTNSKGTIKFYGVNLCVLQGVSDDATEKSEPFSALVEALQKVAAVTADGEVTKLDTEIREGGINPVASGILYDYLTSTIDLSDYVPTERKIADIDLSDDISVSELQTALQTYPILYSANQPSFNTVKGKYGQLYIVHGLDPEDTTKRLTMIYKCLGGNENTGYNWTNIYKSSDFVEADRTIAGLDLKSDITKEKLRDALSVYPIRTNMYEPPTTFKGEVGQLCVGYVMTENPKLYMCFGKNAAGEYIWQLIGGGSGEADLSGYVPTTRTIADIDLSDNITAGKMQEALSTYPIIITHTDFYGGGEGYVGQLAVDNFYKDNPTVYLCTKKEETGDEHTPYKCTWVKIASAKPDLSDVPSWAKEKRPSTYGQPRSLSLLDYFGANKKVVFIGDSITQGFGSTECVSYYITDDDGNNIRIVGNSPEYGELNGISNYEIGKKLYAANNRIWYEALDGNGYAHRLKNYLQNKFGCIAKNYGLSGITTGTLLSQSMNAENSELVTSGGTETVTVNLCDTQDDWVVGEIDTTTGIPFQSTKCIHIADYIELSDYAGDVVVSTSNTKFKVYYYNENNEFTSVTTWQSPSLTLDKTLGAKVLVTVLTGDITKHSEITITAETVTENEGGNIRVIEGLTNGFDTVFLAIGTNDRGFADYTTADGEVITAERQFESNLTRLVKYLVETANKKVILMSMTPCADDGEMRMSMEVIDGIIEQVATNYNVPFISNYQGMLDYCEQTGIDINTLRTDGLHPNDEGYTVVNSIICEQLGIAEVDRNYVDNALANFTPNLSEQDKLDIANLVVEMLSSQTNNQ